MSALAIPAEQRLYPRLLVWLGLAACLFLAFWIQWQVWLIGLGIAFIVLIWHFFRQSQRLRPGR